MRPAAGRTDRSPVVPSLDAARMLAISHLVVAVGGAGFFAQDGEDLPWIGQFVVGAIFFLVGLSIPTWISVVLLNWAARRILEPSTFGGELAIWTGACLVPISVWLVSPSSASTVTVLHALAQALAVGAFVLRWPRPDLA